MGQAGQPDVLDRYAVVQAARHAEDHAGGLRRLYEEAVDRVAEYLLQPEGDAARRAADSAGQVDEERMLRVRRNAERFKLRDETLRRDGVAEEEVLRVLVVDEIALRVGVGLHAPLLHRLAVVRVVLYDLHAVAAQQRLLPRARVGGHVDDGVVADGGAHDADAEAEVARRADLHRVLREEFPRLVRRELFIRIALAQQAVLERELLRVLEHLVDAAARLYRARYRKVAVHLYEEAAFDFRAVFIAEPLLHRRGLAQLGFDYPAGLRRLGEFLHYERSEAREPRLRIVYVRHRKRQASARFLEARELRVEPEYFALFGERPHSRVFFHKLTHLFLVHSRASRFMSL